jgi:hypothetical protein
MSKIKKEIGKIMIKLPTTTKVGIKVGAQALGVRPNLGSNMVAAPQGALTTVRGVKPDLVEKGKVERLLALEARVDGNKLIFPADWWKVPAEIAAKFESNEVAAYEQKLTMIESAFRVKGGVLFGEVFSEFMKFTQASPHLTPLVTDKHLEYVIAIARDLALIDFAEKKAKVAAKAGKSKDFVPDFSGFDFDDILGKI